MLHTAPVNRVLALPLSLSLLPCVSPSFALYFSQADDCDYVKPRLRRRPSEAEPAEGTKEGGEGRRKRGRARAAAKGEGGRGDIALPFRRQTVFYAARDRAITSSRRRLHRSTSEHERRRETGERTDCRLRPMPPTTALATRRRRYMRAQKALSRSSSIVAKCLGGRNE